ncbi:MAG: hypothetical protein EAZ89_09710 [Bacteroidetes bacterium]|nr:MAG: hypothetical protein EAZ89_09710 [Bacteroidota bacterium]
MEKRFTILFAALLLCVVCFAQPKEEKAVRKSFEQYKKALLDENGAKAALWVDRQTIGYYQQVLLWVKEADSAQTDALPLLDKLMVFSVRHRTPHEDILSFDAKALFAYAVEKGMVGKGSVAGNSLGTLRIQNDQAEGQLISQGNPTSFYFTFHKEEGRWKLNLTRIFPLAEPALRQSVTDSEMEENAYFFYILELLTGEKPGPDIWQPVK